MRTDYLYFSNKVLLITQTRCPLVFLVLAMIFVNIKHKKTNVLGTSLTVTSFESSNTPLETWIVVLDSWIKEHKLQATALIEKKLLLLKHSGHSILLPPPAPAPTLSFFLHLTALFKTSTSLEYHSV